MSPPDRFYGVRGTATYLAGFVSVQSYKQGSKGRVGMSLQPPHQVDAALFVGLGKLYVDFGSCRIESDGAHKAAQFRAGADWPRTFGGHCRKVNASTVCCCCPGL